MYQPISSKTVNQVESGSTQAPLYGQPEVPRISSLSNTYGEIQRLPQKIVAGMKGLDAIIAAREHMVLHTPGADTTPNTQR